MHPRVGAKSRERLRQLIRAPGIPKDLETLDWVDSAPGIRFHYLERRSDGVPLRALVWLAAGGTISHHEHETAEDVFVMQGALQLYGGGAGLYEAGHLFHSWVGEVHSGRIVGDGDCLCYVVYWPVSSSH